MDHNSIYKSFFESKRNANCLLELEKSVLSEDVATVLSSIDAFKKVFRDIFKQGMVHSSQKHDTTEEKFRLWLVNVYDDFVSHLITYLIHPNAEIQEATLDALIAAVIMVGEKPFKSTITCEWSFPKDLFQKIIKGLLSPDIDMQHLINKFKKYVIYDDVKMYMLKAILDIFPQMEQVTDVMLVNCFCLLITVKYPNEFPSMMDPACFTPNTLLSQKGIQAPFHLKEKQFGRLFTNAWKLFLQFPLSSSLLKRVLFVLHKRVLSHLQNPCFITDFLTQSYMHGGVVSLLSLNSLFYLMDNFNVEYPDFFQKLYSLFDETIVNGKFAARLFFLSDLFLSSLHLPAYLVAAFAKRLSRIALTSRTDCVLLLIPFVCNLLVRHPTLACLIHRKEPSELALDPFNMETLDPSESRAIESSLWEIKTLQSHVNPEVSRKAKLISQDLSSVEMELSELLVNSTDQMYKRQRKRKFVAIPSNVEKSLKLQEWCIV